MTMRLFPRSSLRSRSGSIRGGEDGLRLFMTADAVGGVFQYALELAGGLAAYDVRTTLALLGPPPTGFQRAAAEAVPGLKLIETDLALDWLASGPAEVKAAAAALAELARAHQPDIVHLNAPALASAAYRMPVVAVVHSCLASWWKSVKDGPPPEDFLWRTELLRDGLAKADAVVCPTEAFAREVQALYGCKPLVVRNGRSSSTVAVSEPSRLAFTAGRLWDEGKNVATLDAAAAMLDLPLLAAGPPQGPNGAQITLRNISALGALGEGEMRARLALRPVFVSAALYEPFGLTVLEAAQAGCTVVLSDIPTFRELWDGAAIFVPPHDAAGFAQAVSRLADDRVLRRAFGTAARERARRYTVEAMAGHMAQIYGALRRLSAAGQRGAAA